MKLQTLQDAIEMSLDNDYRGELDASFNITVNGDLWKCYTVSISSRDVLCYCDKGTATFLVDTYGDKYTFELFDWEKEDAV